MLTPCIAVEATAKGFIALIDIEYIHFINHCLSASLLRPGGVKHNIHDTRAHINNTPGGLRAAAAGPHGARRRLREHHEHGGARRLRGAGEGRLARAQGRAEGQDPLSPRATV